MSIGGEIDVKEGLPCFCISCKNSHLKICISFNKLFTLHDLRISHSFCFWRKRETKTEFWKFKEDLLFGDIKSSLDIFLNKTQMKSIKKIILLAILILKCHAWFWNKRDEGSSKRKNNFFSNSNVEILDVWVFRWKVKLKPILSF